MLWSRPEPPHGGTPAPFHALWLLGGRFVACFLALGKQLAALFLHEQALIEQTAYFLTILCLSAPTLGVINMVTSYFQALGKAAPSLAITVMRNAALFIPAEILHSCLWGLDGVIGVQPVVEAILTTGCLVLYSKELRAGRRRTRKPVAVERRDRFETDKEGGALYKRLALWFLGG